LFSSETISIFRFSFNLIQSFQNLISLHKTEADKRGKTNISSTKSDVGCYEVRPSLLLCWWRRWLKRS